MGPYLHFNNNLSGEEIQDNFSSHDALIPPFDGDITAPSGEIDMDAEKGP